jgi:rhodanese-related sulfurtransferase
MSFQRQADYGGDLSVKDAYALLADDKKSLLVDVRTQPEWAFVGVPDLAELDKAPIFQEWQVYPSMEPAPDFVSRLIATLTARGATPSTPVLFLCRSGVRSRSAAVALSAAGWSRCYNISDGFEGGLDETRKRGVLGGWRARGLPWKQS